MLKVNFLHCENIRFAEKITLEEALVSRRSQKPEGSQIPRK